MSTVKRAAILLVDDHTIFREGVSRMLAREADFDVVGDVATAAEGLGKLRDTAVDVVLLDFDLGGREGVTFAEQARTIQPSARVLVVTAGVDEREAMSLMRAGVAGVFSKRDSAQSLVQTIRMVLAGRVAFDEPLFRRTVGDAAQREERASGSRFTPRERQVLDCVLEGLANKEIADRLGVTESAVKGTLQQLFAKTGVRTRGQLVRIALERFAAEHQR
jgi:DNA-binding NarL/FixJ family response regulator